MKISVFLLSAFVLFFLTMPIFKMILFKSKKLADAGIFVKTIIFFLFLVVVTFILSFPIEFIVNFIYNAFILQ